MTSSPLRPASGRYPAGRQAFPHRDLTGIGQLERHEILYLLDEAEQWVELNRRSNKHHDALAGLTIINAFFENSTRTLLSFEIAGKRLGADVVNMHAAQSSREEGRDADRHRDHAERDERRCDRDPPRLERGHPADRQQGRLPRAQRRRRPARTPDAGAARCAGAARGAQRPGRAERGFHRPHRRDLRRHHAQPGRAFEPAVPAGAGCHRPPVRAAAADAHGRRGDRGGRVPRFRRRALRAPMW
jgi:hypothetical protein